MLAGGEALGLALPGWEQREGQLAMADAVEDALVTERAVFVEAGTGTGKTLAYLVPAILSGRKVVISTATLTLQEQIWRQDLPLVRRVLAPHGVTFEAALMKGLSNYACRRRLREALATEGPLGDARLDALRRWADTSERGDRAEIDLAEDRDGSSLWARVASSPDTRVGVQCAFFEECFVTRMKRAAERAQVVVVNHHLYCADLALRQSKAGEYGAAVLPPHDAVIFDEAHQLEDVATDFFGLRVSTSKVESLLRDAERALVAAGRGSDPVARRAIDRVDASARGFFQQLTARALSGPPRSVRPWSASDADPDSLRPSAPRPWESGARRPLVREMWTPNVAAAHGALDAALEALGAYAEELADIDGLAATARRAARLRVELAEVAEGTRARERVGPADPDAFPVDEPPRAHPTVSWIEVRDRSVSVGASRVDLARELGELVWSRVPTVVCTSATLATADKEGRPSFAFVKERLGAPADASELFVPSPFAFAERAGLYVPRDLPDPGDPEFDAAAAARVAELLDVSGGGAFVLCTSTRAMGRLYDALAAMKRWDVMVQGEGARHALLERFRAHGHAVLVATMSFWEGVDVPGSALRLVVIDRVPFAVPTDPVVMARSETIERAGGNAFLEYTLPAAAILLKQGFGRLLRSSRDAGVVALLDRRVLTKRYGRALLAALPPAKRLHSLADVRAFWTLIGGMDASPAG